MVQDVSWSSTHRSYVQAAGRKKEQRAEERAALLSGMLLEGAPQNFHSHPNGHNLAPDTCSRRKSEEQYLLWVAMGNSRCSYSTVENTPWGRQTSSLCRSVSFDLRLLLRKHLMN